MEQLTPEQYQQILARMAQDDATEKAQLKLQVAELSVRLQAALAASQGAEEATE